ncbi:MAG: MBL fold metallo-hydrolase, partial [Gammaproteobacteria bacterium]|nr:MBL fold metallo-hydrolase [Gammaproteobacteria bacterium]
MKRSTIGVVIVAVIALTIGYLGGIGFHSGEVAEAAGGKVKSPNEVAPDRYVYYPGTEVLARNEARIIACGTGMPAARRGQAAACFLVELGNGDKFLFDLGTGSMANVAALMIPMNYLTKVFASHLHTDHIGDLAALWAGGWTAGRTVPLEVWGPSGSREDMGTAYFVEHFMKAYNWDYMTRAVKISPIPGGITVHEFDYTKENAIIYQENGVTIRSWPALTPRQRPTYYSLGTHSQKKLNRGDKIKKQRLHKYTK